MLSFKKGETPTFEFLLNVPVGLLGTPRCVIRQEEFVAHLSTTIDEEKNTLICYLEEEDSNLLVGGFSAWIEHSWVDDLDHVVVFPAEEIMIDNVFVPYQSFEIFDGIITSEEDELVEEQGDTQQEPDGDYETLVFDEFSTGDTDDEDEQFYEE